MLGSPLDRFLRIGFVQEGLNSAYPAQEFSGKCALLLLAPPGISCRQPPIVVGAIK
jgi:hypothetical protein